MSDQATLSDFASEANTESEVYKCEICGRTFDSTQGRGIHRAKSHNAEEIEEAMIIELKRLVAELGETPSQRQMGKHGRFSFSAYQERFGSWNEALKKAGLTLNKQNDISESELLDELKRLTEEIGRTPTSRDMEQEGEFSSATYVKKFGTWNSAIELAELAPVELRGIPESELLSELERLADKLGQPPTAQQMDKHGHFASNTYSRRFGSWNEALNQVNLSVNEQRDVPESELIKEIERLKSEYSRTPTAQEMKENGGFSINTYKRIFGSWNEALEACELDINNRSNIPKSELVREIRRLNKDIEEIPTSRHMEKKGEFGSATYTRIFGTWNKALKEADLDPKNRRNIPDPELLDEIKSLRDEFGHAPTRRQMDKHGKFDSTTYMSTFESWSDALIQAGFEPHKTLHPDNLDHVVRSTWEKVVAELLLEAGVNYEYESLKVSYAGSRSYTPDFVTENYVIEVKGYIYRNGRQKAKAAIEHLDEKEYIVIGEHLPADIHIPWKERKDLIELV